ncbi:MAG: hypothetical protein WAW26_23240, partial [Anaerolineae bacterium]
GRRHAGDVTYGLGNTANSSHELHELARISGSFRVNSCNSWPKRGSVEGDDAHPSHEPFCQLGQVLVQFSYFKQTA